MILIVALVGLLNSAAHALGPPSVQANQNGIKQYNKENFDGAFKDFARALGKDAYNPSYHFNLGDAFLKNGDVEKAITEYEAAESNPRATSDLKFKSMFNAGNAAIQSKDISKALHYYQKALEYKPDSVEVKTNIELALKEQEKNGGGGGDKDKPKPDDKKDDKQQQGGQGDKKDQDKHDPKQDQDQNEPKKPKPFQSQALNENDVRRILEELKRQEEQIRAKQVFDNKKSQERQIDKDW